jgi:hypothetical protein
MDRAGSFWFPDTVRLHWQYHWPQGPDRHLVATDEWGRIGRGISRFAWDPVQPDSLQVTFGGPYELTIFRGSGGGREYVGELWIFNDGGLSVRAPARLRAVECPNPP